MRKALLLPLALGAGSASAETPSLFGSQQQAVSAISDLGPTWRSQTAPARDFDSPVDTSPAMAFVRQSPKKRRLFFVGGRSADLEWDREGRLDRITLYDPECWPTGRKEAFTILLRHMEGRERDLPILLSTAKIVFDENHVQSFTISIAPQRQFYLSRTSKRYGCGIRMELEPQLRI